MGKEKIFEGRILKTFQPEFLPHDARLGKENERRALSILKEMTEERLIGGGKRATKKQDKKGIDLWVYMDAESQTLKIPVQIKSSGKLAQVFRAYRTDPNEIAVVVVNKYKTDEMIKKEFLRNMRIWIQQNHARIAKVVKARV